MIPRVSIRPPATGRLSGTGGLSLELPSRQVMRTLGIWALILAAGVGLLALRYDWGPDGGRFAERAFLLSAYLLVILLPTSFYLARWILRSSTAAAVLTGALFVVTTLPYKLLGLNSLYYYAGHERPRVYAIDVITPALEFFPGGMLKAFPFDYLFWPLLFLAGAGIVWGIWWLRKRAGAGTARRIPILLTAVFAAICLQAAAHSSMRAPYTYLAYFQRPETELHWYHVYNFREEGQGAVEGDNYAFYALEDYFQGAPRDGNNLLIRRPFSFYIASQASFFVNNYYVWLALNCLFWLVAVFATARLVTRLVNERAGIIAGALTTVGVGFIAFVGTPAMYMQYYAVTAIAICLFEDLVVRRKDSGWGGFALYSGVLGLCALTYDLTPLFLVLLAYGLARKVPLWPMVCSLVGAYAMLRGFTFVVTEVLGIHIVPSNAEQISQAWDGFKTELTHPSLPGWYDHVITIIPRYVRLLLQAFFVIPVIVALFGIRKLRDRATQILVYGLFAVSFATMAFFEIGGAPFLERLPRLVYPVFPAVYLLAALALDPGERSMPAVRSPTRRRLDKLRVAAPWIVVGAMFVLANVDIFGYPTQYVEFFVSDPPAFLPH